MNVKLFTHTDLDGVGCYIVAAHFYENVDVEYCNYDEINQSVEEYIVNRDYINYDLTLITDISVNEINAKLLNDIYESGVNVQLIDHHATAEWLNKYEWANVNPLHEDGERSSGTSMIWDIANQPRVLKEFVEKVRRYDTWEWSTKYNDTHAKELNDLLYLIGRDDFVARFLDDQSIEFTYTEEMIIELEQKKIKKYISNKANEIKVFDILNYKAGVVFAEQYHSELGQELAKKFWKLDFIAIINPSTMKVSYRGIKEEVDLGKDVAKVFGGGGHPRAAGSQIKDNIIKEFINEIFNIK